MDFLYVLEGLRMPVLNEFMLLITRLGEETAFLALALIIFWCVDKRKGYYLMSVGFIGNMVNHVLKLLFRIPRPWILDPNFTILEQAREAATGYSFPSGHSQSAVGTFGSIAAFTKTKWIRYMAIACAVLVPISRMYIGVHTPADVLTASAYSLGLVLLLKPVSTEAGDRYMKPLITVMLVLALGSFAFVHWFPFPEDIDAHNLDSGVKNAYTMLGCLTGVALVYVGEKKYVNFSTEGKWWVQILKVVLGLAVVLLVKEGLRTPLEWFLSKYAARALRYFLIVIAAGLLWPMTFKWFQSLGEKK